MCEILEISGQPWAQVIRCMSVHAGDVANRTHPHTSFETLLRVLVCRIQTMRGEERGSLGDARKRENDAREGESLATLKPTHRTDLVKPQWRQKQNISGF